MAELCRARLLIASAPFGSWRNSLGLDSSAGEHAGDQARHLAADVKWAATKLPFAAKCLPQAIALSRLLRKKRIGHALVFAVRPPAMRGSDDDLHARVEVGGETVLGALPGPWVDTLRLDGRGFDREPTQQ
jgi:hypothetical protein